MTGAIMLHADSDPRDGETIEAAKKRILAAYAAHDPPPSIIVDSGNGLQGLWLLEREFVFPKLTSAPNSKAYDEEVQVRVAPIEDRNRALAIATDAPPGTHNADRLLRLPGTINFPNAKKTAQGRITRQSSIVKLTDVRYPLDRFPAVGQGSSKAAQRANEAKKENNRRSAAAQTPAARPRLSAPALHSRPSARTTRRCATRCSATTTPKSPNGRAPREWTTARASCVASTTER